jgi:hypothetical protein
MKKIILSVIILIISLSLSAQLVFDLGLKGGFNNSKVTANLEEIDSESILKYHIGAFGRLGYNRVFIQPEAYYSAKGGKLEGNIIDVTSRFDFNTLDIPLLLGVKVLKGEKAHLRILAGPVFSILTSNKIEGDDILDKNYYKDNYYGYQYGIGADVFGITLDARIEHGANKFYQQADQGFNFKNNSFMISLGFKIF